MDEYEDFEDLLELEGRLAAEEHAEANSSPLSLKARAATSLNACVECAGHTGGLDQVLLKHFEKSGANV